MLGIVRCSGIGEIELTALKFNQTLLLCFKNV